MAESTSTLTWHEWRSEAERANARRRLHKIVEASTEPSFEAVLRSGRFDSLKHGTGHLVLDYPFVLNAFVDPFYEALATRP